MAKYATDDKPKDGDIMLTKMDDADNVSPNKIRDPHPQDVLSGRGNFANCHDGNEYFRKLVHKHKLEYARCPKQQKGEFSHLIVAEIKARDPPGRFLKQDNKTKLWYDIGEKKL